MYLIFNEVPVDEEDAYEDVKVSESMKSKYGGKFCIIVPVPVHVGN